MAEQLYVARVTANALAAGRFVALVAGEPVELNPLEADELLRIRFVVKATRGRQATDHTEPENANGEGENREGAEDEGVSVVQTVTASTTPERTATGVAQHAKARKGSSA